jgi:thiopurine S-methyltransferase
MWLASRGHRVVGVEMAEQAVVAFFAEHALSPRQTSLGALKRFEAGPFTLWQGDLFACSSELLGKSAAFYDRAALVALPLDLRARYVAKLRELVAADAQGIVITFEYPQDLMPGPPFSVPEVELRGLYGEARIELLEERTAVQAARFAVLGDRLRERCFGVRL